MATIEIGSNLSWNTKIAVGADSDVHRIGGFVVKEYPHLDLATLLNYQRFTNQVAVSLVENPLRRNILLKDDPWTVQFSVVQILEVSEGSHPRARSEYVPGPKGLNMPLGYSLWGAPPDIQELQDDREKSFLLTLYGHLNDINSYGSRIVAATDTSELGERVREETGVKNLDSIDGVNIKLRANPSRKELRVIVTDLGKYIHMLKFRE
jgi:hypothetical protein